VENQILEFLSIPFFDAQLGISKGLLKICILQSMDKIAHDCHWETVV